MARSEINFDYRTAFSRNIGWLTEWEQQRLRAAKVAVAGAGGVGGIHLQTLARLGFSQFHIADLDAYEMANFNRQAGANLDTLGEEKAKVGADLVKAINPEADTRIFPNGVSEDNLDAFLDGVDVYIDGLDFFVLDVRAALFRKARARGITAITAAPIGMGTGYLIFTPDGMSFDDFFALSNSGDALDDAAGFLVGLTPSMLHRGYLADQSQVDLIGQRGPSTAIACQLCAGVAAGEAVKAVLGRGTRKPAPYYHHFDAYRQKFVTRKLYGGAANPFQRIKRTLVKSLAGKFSSQARPKEDDLCPEDSVLDRVLEAGRWSPSADNTQPWRFHIASNTHFDVCIKLDHDNIYEYRRSEPTLLAVGMLLETMRLRAAHYGHTLRWSIAEETDDALRIECVIAPSPSATAEPQLDHMIELRRVERSMLSSRRLTLEEKSTLEGVLGANLQIQWHEPFSARLAQTWLNVKVAALRFKTPETIPVHQKVVRFDTPFPRYGLPAKGLGLSGLARGIMQWALSSKTKARWLIGRLGGAYYAAFEMDVLPGLASSAHYTIAASKPVDQMPTSGILEIGQNIQRFWLKSSKLGLAFQPSCAAICFYSYGVSGEAFSASKRRLKEAKRFASAFEAHYGGDASCIVFRGRLGPEKSRAGRPRSIREPRSALIAVDARTSAPKSLFSVQSAQKLSVG